MQLYQLLYDNAHYNFELTYQMSSTQYSDADPVGDHTNMLTKISRIGQNGEFTIVKTGRLLPTSQSSFSNHTVQQLPSVLSCTPAVLFILTAKMLPRDPIELDSAHKDHENLNSDDKKQSKKAGLTADREK